MPPYPPSQLTPTSAVLEMATSPTCSPQGSLHQPKTTPSSVTIRVPDSLIDTPYALRINPHQKQASASSESWLITNGNLSEKKRKEFHGLKAGLLTAMCFPEAPPERLRVICDFSNWLFHLDNISDSMDEKSAAQTGDTVLGVLKDPLDYRPATRLGRMTRDFWRRLIKTASVTAQQRFVQGMELFFTAIGIESIHRHSGKVYDLEDYIQLRRDTSGCKPCFALIEYSYGLDIPEAVMQHGLIQSLNNAATDVIAFSNDILSFNVEQARGDTHNMVMILMNERKVTMQGAIDLVGGFVEDNLMHFEENKLRLPSWGEAIDKEVQLYVQGLEDWMAGTLHWSYESERYLGKLGRQVKQTKQFVLLPRRSSS